MLRGGGCTGCLGRPAVKQVGRSLRLCSRDAPPPQVTAMAQACLATSSSTDDVAQLAGLIDEEGPATALVEASLCSTGGVGFASAAAIVPTHGRLTRQQSSFHCGSTRCGRSAPSGDALRC